MFGLWNTYYLMLIYFSLKLDLLAVNWLDASTILVCKESQLFRHMPIWLMAWIQQSLVQEKDFQPPMVSLAIHELETDGPSLIIHVLFFSKKKSQRKKIKMCRLAVSLKSQRNSNYFLITIIISLGPYMNPTKFYLVSNNPGKGTRLIAILKFEPFH